MAIEGGMAMMARDGDGAGYLVIEGFQVKRRPGWRLRDGDGDGAGYLVIEGFQVKRRPGWRLREGWRWGWGWRWRGIEGYAASRRDGD